MSHVNPTTPFRDDLPSFCKHIATQKTVTCRLLAHTYTIRPKLHLVDLLPTYYTSTFASNTQEIELVELEPQCIAVGERNRGPSSTILLIAVNSVPWRNLSKSTVLQAKMGHVSQTTPLSGTVCSPYAWTDLYQIWNLYVDTLQIYERRRKMQKFGWFGELGVTQGHQQQSHSIERIRFPIRL